MTHEELEALGMTDKQLAEEYRKLFGKEVDLSDPDRRRMAFDAVMARWHTSAVVTTERKLGPFAVDDPEEHERSKRR